MHAGGILAAASDGARIVTGGDDGKVVATDADGESSEIVATDAKQRWIDHVALGPDGAVAWSAGKHGLRAHRQGRGARRSTLPSTVGGLAFAPKGFGSRSRTTTASTLWFPNAQAAPEMLEWKGSHLDVTFSPDGHFLVTSDAGADAARLAARRRQAHAHVGLCRARCARSAGRAGGKWLATSGSEQLILWPFQRKDGPMGKQPRMVAPPTSAWSRSRAIPTQEVVAVGYEDGMVLLVRIEDGAEILAKKPGSAPVSALAWSDDGTLLAFGTEDGEAGVVDLA